MCKLTMKRLLVTATMRHVVFVLLRLELLCLKFTFQIRKNENADLCSTCLEQTLTMHLGSAIKKGINKKAAVSCIF